MVTWVACGDRIALVPPEYAARFGRTIYRAATAFVLSAYPWPAKPWRTRTKSLRFLYSVDMCFVLPADPPVNSTTMPDFPPADTLGTRDDALASERECVSERLRPRETAERARVAKRTREAVRRDTEFERDAILLQRLHANATPGKNLLRIACTVYRVFTESLPRRANSHQAKLDPRCRMTGERVANGASVARSWMSDRGTSRMGRIASVRLGEREGESL
jgi:hypothetical protein